MAYPTEEICKIRSFRFWVCTKVGFGSCSARINIVNNDTWLFRGPFLTGIKQNSLLVTFLIQTLCISIVTILPHLCVSVPVTLFSQYLA